MKIDIPMAMLDLVLKEDLEYTTVTVRLKICNIRIIIGFHSARLEGEPTIILEKRATVLRFCD